MSQLAEIVSTLLMVPGGELKPETSLQPLRTSLGSVRLGLALKRAGLQLPGNKVPATFRDLEIALSGNTAAPDASNALDAHGAPIPQASSSNGGGLQVGLDVQEIAGLPEAADYWEHEFYRETFDKSEIAYAVVKPEPRIHLAGFWCAKEALRKCDPSFAGANPASTAVAHDESGKPYLLSVTAAGRIRLPHALSISHSGPVSSAVVIAGSAAPAPAAPVVIENKPTPSQPSSRPGIFPAVAGVLGLLALAGIYLYMHGSF
jgi:phosphopantetheinyl transferase (holo-ACP synthase)